MKTVTPPRPKLRPAVGNFVEQAPQRATDPLDHPDQCRIAPATLIGNFYSFKRLTRPFTCPQRPEKRNIASFGSCCRDISQRRNLNLMTYFYIYLPVHPTNSRTFPTSAMSLQTHALLLPLESATGATLIVQKVCIGMIGPIPVT